MKRLVIILFSVVMCSSICTAEKVRLSKGTVIAVMFMNDMDSKLNVVPKVVVLGDIYDDSGEIIIIKKNTVVAVQSNVKRGNAWTSEVGSIEIVPISTTAINGRLIAFDAEPVVFKGIEAVRSKNMQAKITRGTSFRATVANTYVFNIE